MPAESPRHGSDAEAEPGLDAVAYAIGNWGLCCNFHPEKASEYCQRVAHGKVWVSWGFIGAEREIGEGKSH